MTKVYMICTIFYDPFGRIIGFGFYNQQYEHRSSAIRRAKQLYGDNPLVEWFIVEESPEYAIFMPMIYY